MGIGTVIMFVVFTIAGGPFGFILALIIFCIGNSRSKRKDEEERHEAELSELQAIKAELAKRNEEDT